MPKNLVWSLVVLVINFSGCFTEGSNNTTVSTRPDVVSIASILTFDSIIGKVAKIALQAAIEDVNYDPTILKGTKLKMTLHDANYSGFLSMMAGVEPLQRLGQNVATVHERVQQLAVRTVDCWTVMSVGKPLIETLVTTTPPPPFSMQLHQLCKSKAAVSLIPAKGVAPWTPPKASLQAPTKGVVPSWNPQSQGASPVRTTEVP